MEGYALGSRVRDIIDGTRGTVKYIGPVAAAKNKTELWLGVEWDNIGRGKHDGSCVDEASIESVFEKCFTINDKKTEHTSLYFSRWEFFTGISSAIWEMGLS